MSRAIKYMGVDVLQNGNKSSGIVTGTATGLRISSVDGTAFLDNNSEIIKYVGKRIQILDASSRILEGWIKAVGISEGLGSDLGTGLDLTNGSVWSPTNATILSANSFKATAVGYVYIYYSAGIADTKHLRKTSLTDTNGLSGGRSVDITGNSSNPLYAVDISSIYHDGVMPGTRYQTATNTTFRFQCYAELANQTLSDIVLSSCQVTAPSSSGVTIVSTENGSTYNFTSKDASFAYNAASYAYKIFN